MENHARETIEFDVLYVGAGPASLSSALYLSNLLKKENLKASIVIIEKADELGAHSISGAVLNPKTLEELIPNFKELNAPLNTKVANDGIYFLTQKKAFKLPVVPPPLNNHGYYIISLNNFVKWLGKIVETNGVDMFFGFPGQAVLYEGSKIIGI